MPTIDLGSVVGPQGPQGTGSQGPQGPQGPAGPNQITTTTSTPFNGVIVGNGSACRALAIDAQPTNNSNGMVNSGAIYTAIHSQTALISNPVVVTSDTTVNLSSPASDFSFLILYGTAGGTAAGNRFCIILPVVALANGYFAPVAANSTVGYIRVGYTDSNASKLRIISQSYSSMTLNAIYGKL